MDSKVYVLLWVVCLPSAYLEVDFDTELTSSEDRWTFRHKKQEELEVACAAIRPSARDIVRRFYAILPYFDKEHANTAFLHKLRGTVYAMSEGEDVLDREAAFYATVLTPIVFLQQYRDTWCLLERVRTFVYDLPGPTAALRHTTASDSDDEELHDKKDIKYLKELIKNLG